MVEPINTQDTNADTNATDDKSQQTTTQLQTDDKTKQPDLVSRVSQVKQPDTKPTDTDTFNVNDIEKITDPDAKAYAQSAYKSLEKGYQVKYQDLATLRKQLEAQDPSNWTPEKVRSLTQDPKFVAAAQSIMQSQSAGLTDDEYSALTDGEKKQLTQMQQQINSMSQQNVLLMTKQQDEGLRTKYSNYNSESVDNAVQSLLAGKVNNTREWIHKALDYEDGIQRAYKLGLEDRKLELGDKVSSISTESSATNIQPSGEVPAKEEKESPVEYFKRLATRRLAEKKQT